MKKRNKVLIIVMITSTILIGGVVIAYNKINNIKNVDLKVSKEELNISQEASEKSKEKNIQNILLLGIDKQENASDAIIVLSINKEKNDIKMTSIQRDSRVFFGEGYGNKINYAYHYGGVELSIQKINELYELDIDKYVKVTFEDLMKCIDYLGGINLNITDDELKYINGYIDGINKLENTNVEKIKKSGRQHVNGTQALAYCRIRYTDGGDAKRTERHRIVLLELFKQIKEISPTQYFNVVSELTSYVETNLSTFEMLDLGKIGLVNDVGDIKELRLPLDGTISHFNDPTYNMGWEKQPNLKALHQFIYGE